MKNDIKIPRYDRLTRYLHWIVAISIIYITFVGYSLAHISEPDVFTFFSELNMSLATVVAALMTARFVWRFFRPSINKPDEAHAEKSGVANLAHELFYIIIFVVLISGFLMLKHSFNFFWLVRVPRPIAVDAVNDFFSKIHHYSVISLTMMFLLHMVAVLKYYIVDRYPIISRMI